MKAVRIVLLVLIIIGIIALCTEKIWVPVLVNKIISHEGVPAALPINQPAISLKNGRQCYTYSQDATAAAPYAVSEFIDITIKDSSVSGTKTGTQHGPDMDNGYSGTIQGTLSNNTITDIFSYVVEGSHNQEKELYRTTQTGIEKLRYPLIEQNGILVPDTTKSFTVLKYARVGCTASD